jgi:plastocyanin
VFLPSGGPTFDGTATTGAGQLGGGPTNPTDYKLTFTKAGSFGYLCSFHSGIGPDGKLAGMLGNVVVQDAGTAYPKSGDQVNSDAQASIATDQANVVKGEPDVQKLAQATRPGPNGTTIYQVNVGGSNMAVGADYMRFYPSELTVHQGDSVEWVWHGLPHTVLFASGGKEPDLILPQPQPNGPPKLLLNPQIAFPVGGKTYNGTGLFNSGTPQNPTNADGSPVTYKLTFTKPGKYEYICAFHDQEGMSGHITVLAAITSGTPMMPQTGSGGDAGFGWLLALAVGLLAAGLLLKRRMTTLAD